MPALLLGAGLNAGAAEASRWERSFWLHASLGLDARLNYWGTNFPATPMPTEKQVQKAARLLAKDYAANRLYLIYHRELPLEDARRLFAWWRKATPRGVELVPTLVLRMYDRNQTPVFATNELAELAAFFRQQIHPRRLGIYDVHVRPFPPEAMSVLANRFPSGLIRVGLQPGEPLDAPFVAGVHDTWSALCHGKDNTRDWQQPGFGAETLRNWILARNRESRPIAWNLVVVAWDYTPTERGDYPGYDDAEKNMPLPEGRNRAAMQIIRETARPPQLAGFSSDLFILHVNSRAASHDGAGGAFYECLKRGEDYSGYYATPFQEIVSLYRELRARQR